MTNERGRKVVLICYLSSTDLMKAIFVVREEFKSH